MHVDAAHAGTAGLLPELRHHFDGLELADSYDINPHKCGAAVNAGVSWLVLSRRLHLSLAVLLLL